MHMRREIGGVYSGCDKHFLVESLSHGTGEHDIRSVIKDYYSDLGFTCADFDYYVLLFKGKKTYGVVLTVAPQGTSLKLNMGFVTVREHTSEAAA